MTKISNQTPTLRQALTNVDTNPMTNSIGPSLTPTLTGLGALAPGDTVKADDQAQAKALIDDGKPKNDTPAPEGNPELNQDFNLLRSLANAGGRPTTNTEVTTGGTTGWIEEKKNAADEASGGTKATLFDAKKTVKDFGQTKKTYSKTGGWTDTEEAKKKRGDNVTAHATLLNVNAKAEVGYNLAAGEHTTEGGTTVEGNVTVAKAMAKGSASVGVDLKKAELEADVSGRAGAYLVDAKGSVKTDTPLGELKLGGEAFVGAETNGNVGVHFNPRKGDVKVQAGLEGFAGAKASLDVRQKVTLGGNDIGSVGVRGEAYAGIGAKAKVSAQLEDGKFKASVELGAALGVGVGVKFNVDVDVKGTYHAAKDAAVAVKDKAVAAWNRYKPW